VSTRAGGTVDDAEPAGINPDGLPEGGQEICATLAIEESTARRCGRCKVPRATAQGYS